MQRAGRGNPSNKERVGKGYEDKINPKYGSKGGLNGKAVLIM